MLCYAYPRRYVGNPLSISFAHKGCSIKTILLTKQNIISQYDIDKEGKPTASVCRPDGRVAECGPQAKVSNPSSLIGPESVHFLSLKSCHPMCGPTPEPRVRTNLNPAAEEFMPRPRGWFDQGLALGQFLLQQMSHFLLVWPQQVGCSGVQPWLWTPCMALPLG